MRVKTWIVFAIVILLFIAVWGFYSALKKGSKSSADKIITILCSILGAIVALLGIQMTQQNIVNISSDIIDGATVIIGDGNVVTTTINDNNMSEETIYLVEAENDLKLKQYDEAFCVFAALLEKGYDSGALGLGYMYAHGYGVPQDIEKAIDLYDSIPEQKQARKNKLALFIATNQEETYVRNEIEYFIQNEDSDVRKYIECCSEINGIEISGEKILLSNLRCYSLKGKTEYDNPPRDTGYSVFILVGSHYPEDGKYSLPMYTYEEYGLLGIEYIERAIMK